MKILAGLLGLVAFSVAPRADACYYRCQYNQDCYFCVPGQRFDSCGVTCDACVGQNCLGAASELFSQPEPSAEDCEATPVDDSLPALHRFEWLRLATVIHPSVARVFESFWNWHDSVHPGRREVLDLAGGIKIDGEPHDFSLTVRRRGDAQLYNLVIEGFGRALLTVHPPAEGKQRLEFEALRPGEARPRTGELMVDAP